LSKFCLSLSTDFLLVLNPLNTKLNPICHLLALVGTHHIVHVSRVRVNKEWKHREQVTYSKFYNFKQLFSKNPEIMECAHLLAYSHVLRLRGADWCLQTFLVCLTLEHGTHKLCRNAARNYLSTLRNISKEQRRHLHRGGSFKSQRVASFLHALDPNRRLKASA
jgi:hypothetical protein